MELKINLETDSDKLRKAKVLTSILLSGKIYSARDAAHKKIKELLDAGVDLPISIKNSIIYYMGPTPKRPGYQIGSCGPTSSYRMDSFLEMTMKMGIAGTLGKGERADFIDDLIIKYKTPYLITIGGAGAYLAECVLSSKTVLFEELGPEAITEMVVKDMPVIVAIDIYGNKIFKK
jgi:fumarate hydratase subunit beta